MNKFNLFCYSILFSFLCFSCKDSEKTISSLTTIPVNIKEAKSADFAEFFDIESLEMVRLDPDVLLDEIDKFSLNDDYILVSDNDKLVAYQQDGNYAWQIDRKGEGPREYTSIRDFRLNEENEVFLFTGKKILKFDAEQKFLQSYAVPVSCLAFHPVGNSDQFLLYNGFNNITDSINSRLLLLSPPKITKQYKKIPETELSWRYIFDDENFFTFEDQVYFYHSINDTIYSFDQVEEKINPFLHIDYGNNSMPASFINQKYEDISEFSIAAERNDYIYSTVAFLPGEDYYCFSIIKERDLYQVIHHHSLNETHVIYEWKNFLGMDANIQVSFSSILKYSHDNSYYFLIESYNFPELDLQEGVYIAKIKLQG